MYYLVDPKEGRNFTTEVVTQDDLWGVKAGYAKDLCRCSISTDFTQVMAPGYHKPQDIAAIEYGDYAFYRVWWRGRAHIAVLESFQRCVMRTPPSTERRAEGRGRGLRSGNGDNGGGGESGIGDPNATEPITFSFCQGNRCPQDMMNSCQPTPLIMERPHMRIPALAVLYALPGAVDADGGSGAGDERADQAALLAAQSAAAVDAAALLLELNGKMPSLSRSWARPRVPPKGADGLPLLPTWLPPKLLLQLVRLRMAMAGPDGGRDGAVGGGREEGSASVVDAALGLLDTVTAGAVTVGDAVAGGTAIHRWTLGLPHADEALRPSVGDVLWQRAEAARAAGGVTPGDRSPSGAGA
ncbi:unnamed protein product [Phaeothamnion confervicola]